VRAWLALGPAFAVAGLAACGAPARGSLVTAPVLSVAAGASTTGPETRRFRSAQFGRQVVGADSLSEAEALGTWHDEIMFDQGRAVRVARVGPSGLLSSVTRIEYGPAGGYRLTHLDAYGVEGYRETVTPEGARTRSYRSGVSSERGCASLRERYDAHGLVESASCLDENGRVVTDNEGCEERRLEYDDHLRIQTESCFAADGTPATFGAGGHAVRTGYDERGFRSAVSRRGSGGASATDDQGCAVTRYARDKAGDALTTSCFDGSGAPHGMSGSAAVVTRIAYDANGCILREESVNALGGLTPILGIAQRVFTRDPECGILSSLQRDELGRAAAPDQKAASHEFVRNHAGLAIEERCRSASNLPISCRDGRGTGGALVRYAYDERGRERLRTGFTADGSKSPMSATYPHEWRFTYLADGLSREVAYFDEAGQPAFANGDVAKHAFLFDRLGSVESVKSLDATGALTSPTTGCSELHRTYDVSHRLASIECRGRDGAPSESTLILEAIHWPTHAARVVVERKGSDVANAYFDVNGSVLTRVPCAAERCFR